MREVRAQDTMKNRGPVRDLGTTRKSVPNSDHPTLWPTPMLQNALRKKSLETGPSQPQVKLPFRG